MGSHQKQLKASLLAYLKRGEKAVSCLATDNIDKAIDFLNWRLSAFHNFRAAISIEKKSGFAIESEPEILAILCQIDVLNQKLEQLINGELLVLKEKLKQVLQVKSKISKFRSGNLGLNAIESRV